MAWKSRDWYAMAIASLPETALPDFYCGEESSKCNPVKKECEDAIQGVHPLRGNMLVCTCY